MRSLEQIKEIEFPPTLWELLGGGGGQLSDPCLELMQLPAECHSLSRLVQLRKIDDCLNLIHLPS